MQHETAIDTVSVPTEQLTTLADEESFVSAVSLSETTARNVWNIISRRANNRSDERYDNVVTFEEWAYADWSDIDVSDGPMLLVGQIEDYSEDAYFCRGAFNLSWDLIEGEPTEAVEDEWITDLLNEIDDDATDRMGALYLPKSAVSGIYGIDT